MQIWMDKKLTIVGKDNSNTVWTKEQDDYLTANYENATWKEMTSYLGRSNKAIRDRARKLAVRRKSRRKTHEKFVEEFYNMFDRDEYTLLSEYKGNHKYVTYFHTTCGKTNESTPASLLVGHGCICNKVNSGKVYLEDFLERLKDMGNDQYTLTNKLPYVNTTTKVELLHKKCGNTYKTTPRNFFNSRRCTFCANKGNSKGERLVESALVSLGVAYMEQATFKGMKHYKQLYYDFLLDDIDVIIEYQGVQHYRPVEYLGGFKKFASQLKRDEIKAEFAKDNGYKLIEVPYNLDTYTKVLNYLKEELLA